MGLGLNRVNNSKKKTMSMDGLNRKNENSESTYSTNDNVYINRAILRQKSLDQRYLISEPRARSSNVKSQVKNGLRKLGRKCHPKSVLNLFTILNMISEYDFKKFLLNDIISGLTGNFFVLFAVVFFSSIYL